jgi:hypothetical protein
MGNDSQNGWNEYSRLVLKELETLTDGITALRDEISGLKQEIALLKSKEDRVSELKVWKDKIDEVASPTQLKVLTEDVESLKVFKTKAVTVFAVVQFTMAAILFAMKFAGGG